MHPDKSPSARESAGFFIEVPFAFDQKIPCLLAGALFLLALAQSESNSVHLEFRSALRTEVVTGNIFGTAVAAIEEFDRFVEFGAFW